LALWLLGSFVWSGNIYRREGIPVERNTAGRLRLAFVSNGRTERESGSGLPGDGNGVRGCDALNLLVCLISSRVKRMGGFGWKES
jgi:hypothetical protein